MTTPIVPASPEPSPSGQPPGPPPLVPSFDQQGRPGFWVWSADQWVWQPQPQPAPSFWSSPEGIVTALMIAGGLALIMWVTYGLL